MKDEDDHALSRAQSRSLRRIYNGRSVPILADGKTFLTYKDARHYLLSLPREARDAAYAEMRNQGGIDQPDAEPEETTASPKSFP
ncbi:hypothetical protein [Sphingobium subterraneum]|uniref:Alpha-beta hydrolase superfamily lysophospholipase n=1 Tax=Sphingobium subterraneum TaxID=627688 RepID=A0A841IZM3_9SPHN|nr:hypothetical protein [Sphingobium subterraneum]MBB6124037.1 alpha-beta hydrolase superfamily lysophospholipase [Sphingobium subterraneum]